jgi:hypothetical protein
MRTFVMVEFSLLIIFLTFTSPARAQDSGRSRAGSFPTAIPSARSGERSSAVRDLLSPYDEPVARSGSGYRTYTRTPANPPHEETDLRGPAPRHNYFPNLRSGQGPNRNVIDPRTLCVPGRRAMLQR